jgi:hypothetical protein
MEFFFIHNSVKTSLYVNLPIRSVRRYIIILENLNNLPKQFLFWWIRKMLLKLWKTTTITSNNVSKAILQDMIGWRTLWPDFLDMDLLQDEVELPDQALDMTEKKDAVDRRKLYPDWVLDVMDRLARNTKCRVVSQIETNQTKRWLKINWR